VIPVRGEIDRRRERSTWKGAALIAHAWALILGTIALVAWWPNPADVCFGRRRHRLAPARPCDPDADGRMGCLSPDEKTNLT